MLTAHADNGSLGSAAHRTAHMTLRSQQVASRDDKTVQRFQAIVHLINEFFDAFNVGFFHLRKLFSQLAGLVGGKQTLRHQQTFLDVFENVVILVGRVHKHRYESAQLVEGALSLQTQVVLTHSRAVHQRSRAFVARLSVNFHTFNI